MLPLGLPSFRSWVSRNCPRFARSGSRGNHHAAPTLPPVGQHDDRPVRARARTAGARLGAGPLARGAVRATASSNEPNVILILTDDQTLDEMRALPKTQALIGGPGVTFNRAYISYPLCCPSRVSILQRPVHAQPQRARQRVPDRRLERFRNGTEEKALPTWLQSAGYYNVEVGKYMNGYAATNAADPAGLGRVVRKFSEYDEIPDRRLDLLQLPPARGPARGGHRVPCPAARSRRRASPSTASTARARGLPDRRRRRQGRERDRAPQRARLAAEAVLPDRRLQRAALALRPGAASRRRLRRRRAAEVSRAEREGRPRQAPLPAPPAEARQGQAQPDRRPPPRPPRDAALGRRAGRRRSCTRCRTRGRARTTPT